jgi:hypothetical protein
MAVGGSNAGLDMGCDYAEVSLTERLNGGRWSVSDLKCFEGESSGFNDVSCISDTACMVVGGVGNSAGSGPVARRWNGSKWETSWPAIAAHDAFVGVSCTSKRSCVAVVASGNSDLVRWNGRTWSAENGPPQVYLAAVSCTSRDSCVAVGDNGQSPASLVLGARLAPTFTG